VQILEQRTNGGSAARASNALRHLAQHPQLRHTLSLALQPHALFSSV
jgi:hypothetical protein